VSFITRSSSHGEVKVKYAYSSFFPFPTIASAADDDFHRMVPSSKPRASEYIPTPTRFDRTVSASEHVARPRFDKGSAGLPGPPAHPTMPALLR
jgi:hypothetical protein